MRKIPLMIINVILTCALLILAVVFIGEFFAPIENITFENGINEGEYLWEGLIIICIFAVPGCITLTYFAWDRMELIEGSNRKIRKLERKKLKLKREKKYKKLKKETKEECAKLKCEIKQLERDLENKQKTCASCGRSLAYDACFCSGCGGKI